MRGAEASKIQPRDVEATPHRFVGGVRFRRAIAQGIFRVRLERGKWRPLGIFFISAAPCHHDIFRQSIHRIFCMGA